MSPGQHLDAQIARRLWRAIVLVDTTTGHYTLADEESRQPVPLPAFSTEVDAMNRVVGVLQARGFAVRVSYDPHTAIFHARFTRGSEDPDWLRGESLPHAVCLAALAVRP